MTTAWKISLIVSVIMLCVWGAMTIAEKILRKRKEKLMSSFSEQEAESVADFFAHFKDNDESGDVTNGTDI